MKTDDAVRALVALGLAAAANSCSIETGPPTTPSTSLTSLTVSGPSVPANVLGTCFQPNRNPVCSSAFGVGAVGAASAPSAPGSLTANVTGSTVTLMWTAPGVPPASYVLEAGSGPGLANIAAFDTDTATTTFSAVGVPTGTYFVRVKARNADGISGPSNEIAVSVGGDVCVVPDRPLLTAAATGTTVTLTWTRSTGATSYRLEAGSTSGASNVFSAEVGNLVTLVSSAPPGAYFIRVTARSGCGTSPPSNEAAIRIGPATPQQISPVDGSVFSNFPRATTLYWSIVPGAATYTIELDCFHCCQTNKWCTDVGQTWWVVSGLTATSYAFNFVGAQPGRWRVWAVDAARLESPRTGWWTFSYTR